MDLASAEAEIRHVFGDTPITEASIGAAPPDILVVIKLSGAFSRCNKAHTRVWGSFHASSASRQSRVLITRSDELQTGIFYFDKFFLWPESKSYSALIPK